MPPRQTEPFSPSAFGISHLSTSSGKRRRVHTPESSLQRMLRLLGYFTAEEMVGNLIHLEQFK